jgi:hypothetical protein
MSTAKPEQKSADRTATQKHRRIEFLTRRIAEDMAERAELTEELIAALQRTNHKGSE